MNFVFEQVIGVGGIGKGCIYELIGNETLGRNESRMALLSQKRDYCKLHIVSHYMAKLLGESATIVPIGKVGDDPTGRELLEEMRRVGLQISHIAVSHQPTMSAVCFTYPDGEGGNITSANSACERVDAKYVHQAMERIQPHSEIILSLPEVPIESRLELLRIGRTRGSFNVCSFVKAEAAAFFENLGLIDLLAVNMEEAKALTETAACSERASVEACFAVLREKNPKARLLVTAGANGVFACDNGIIHIPAFETHVVSTAGAGDAVLGGTLAGLMGGLPFLPKLEVSHEIGSAIELGAIVAALSVRSPDTIAFDVDSSSVLDYASAHGSPSVALLEILEHQRGS